IIASESGLPPVRCRPLVLLAQRLRALADIDLEEGCSTRLLVYAATLIAGGMRIEDAVLAAMIEPLTDDAETRRGLIELAQVTLG
ncbi:CbbQ/NirQ/NorQ C-terminal domain-containing protein, partial [Methylocella sp.]|uniref:CbbQ/NirQ/NorQ domain-containing protein n=1 Tax=Methylocella sp. TaxID=1978226 RepID=UPI003C1F6B3E